MKADWYLVTNNPKARDALGRMSHVWLTDFVQKTDDPEDYTGFICYDKSDRLIHNLSHYIPLAFLPREKENLNGKRTN